MRTRLALLVATSLASLLFLFSVCINSVFAQPGPGQGQGPRQGEVHLPSPLLPDQRNGVGLCPVVNIAMRFRDGGGQEGVDRFFTSDDYHWVEDWIPFSRQRESDVSLFALDRHDYTVYSCDRRAVVLYNVELNTTSYFNLERMFWSFYCGAPTDRPRDRDRDCPGNRYDIPIEHVLFRVGNFNNP
jgi:hypothetical protein